MLYDCECEKISSHTKKALSPLAQIIRIAHFSNPGHNPILEKCQETKAKKHTSCVYNFLIQTVSRDRKLSSVSINFVCLVCSYLPIRNSNENHHLMTSQPEQPFGHSTVGALQQGPAVREVNLVLESSALIRGFGNVKRWFSPNYSENHLLRGGVPGDEKVQLGIYVPLYTLRDLEYLSRGNSSVAAKYREALAFLRKIYHSQDNQDLQEEPGVSKKSRKRNMGLDYNVEVEERTTDFPDWNQCIRYTKRLLRVKDFPHHSKASSSMGEQTAFGIGQNQKEQSPDELMNVPPRLKHLIRACVYKRYIEKGNKDLPPLKQWKLVTEDVAIRIWATNFGIDCLNVNEAELLILFSENATDNDPVSDFNASNNANNQLDHGFVHHRVDTTAYEYHPLLEKDTSKKLSQLSEESAMSKVKSRSFSKKPPVTIVNGVKQEDFNMITYAPRVAGILWTDDSKKKK